MWVTELLQAGLEPCHCPEEFILRRIHPLGCQEKLTFESLQFTNLSRNPAPSKTLTFTTLSFSL
jgi:hypothetical protein